MHIHRRSSLNRGIYKNVKKSYAAIKCIDLLKKMWKIWKKEATPRWENNIKMDLNKSRLKYALDSE